jgi:Repeat of unknown function (DUF5907)
MEQGLQGFPRRVPPATGGGGLPPDGIYADITVSGSGTIWTINNGAVTTIKILDGAVTEAKLTLVDNTTWDSSTLQHGFLKKLSGVAGQYMDGQGNWTAVIGLSDGNKGDITVSGSGTSWTVNNQAITFAKFQNIATDRILGRDTAGSGSVEELTVSNGLEFTGTGIQRSALTGEVTATAGSNATVLDKTAISNRSSVTPTVSDTLLIGDQSDSDNLKKITVQGIVDLASATGMTQGKVVAAIGGWAMQ